MTVRQMLTSMSASEFAEWHEYYKLEPWGEQRSDWRSGEICATVANVNRSKKSRVYKATDFMPKFESKTDEAQRMTPEQSVAYARYMSSLIEMRQRKRDGR